MMGWPVYDVKRWYLNCVDLLETRTKSPIESIILSGVLQLLEVLLVVDVLCCCPLYTLRAVLLKSLPRSICVDVHPVE